MSGATSDVPARKRSRRRLWWSGRVTQRIASSSSRKNLEDRELIADQTNEFLKAELEDLQRRLVESDLELAEMKRRGLTVSPLVAEHEVLLATYKQVFAFSAEAKLASDMERRQIGEQFRIIDGARLPEAPIAPRMVPYLALGALSGFGAGVVASLLLLVWRRGRPRPVPAP